MEENYPHRLGAQQVSDHQFAVQSNTSYMQCSSLLTPAREWVELIRRTMGGARHDGNTGYEDSDDDELAVERKSRRSSRLGCSGPLSLFDSVFLPAA